MTDSDGEIILIEAADVVPRYINILALDQLNVSEMNCGEKLHCVLLYFSVGLSWINLC